jgi:UDP-N-acetylglucosamine 2-epimerase
MVRGAPALGEAGRREMTRTHPIAAARPSLMKTAPVRFALQRDSRLEVTIVQTGLHDGPNMPEAFIRDPVLTQTHPGAETGSASKAEPMADSVAYRRAVAAERRVLARARREPAPHPEVRQSA